MFCDWLSSPEVVFLPLRHLSKQKFNLILVKTKSQVFLRVQRRDFGTNDFALSDQFCFFLPGMMIAADVAGASQ